MTISWNRMIPRVLLQKNLLICFVVEKIYQRTCGTIFVIVMKIFYNHTANEWVIFHKHSFYSLNTSTKIECPGVMPKLKKYDKEHTTKASEYNYQTLISNLKKIREIEATLNKVVVTNLNIEFLFNDNTVQVKGKYPTDLLNNLLCILNTEVLK